MIVIQIHENSNFREEEQLYGDLLSLEHILPYSKSEITLLYNKETLGRPMNFFKVGRTTHNVCRTSVMQKAGYT